MEALELRKHLQKELKFFKKRRFEKMDLVNKLSYIAGVATWYFVFFPTTAKEKLAVKELREVERNASGLAGLYEEYREEKDEKGMRDMEKRLPYFLEFLIGKINLASHYLSWSN